MRYKRPLLTFIAVVVITIVTLSLRLGRSPVSTTMLLAAQYGDGAYGEMPLLNLTSVWFELHCERLLLVVRTNYSIEAYTPAGRTNYDGPFGFSGKAFQFIGAKVQPGNFPVRVGLPVNATKFRVKIEMKEYGSVAGRMHGSGINFRARDILAT